MIPRCPSLVLLSVLGLSQGGMMIPFIFSRIPSSTMIYIWWIQEVCTYLLSLVLLSGQPCINILHNFHKHWVFGVSVLISSKSLTGTGPTLVSSLTMMMSMCSSSLLGNIGILWKEHLHSSSSFFQVYNLEWPEDQGMIGKLGDCWRDVVHLLLMDSQQWLLISF